MAVPWLARPTPSSLGRWDRLEAPLLPQEQLLTALFPITRAQRAAGCLPVCGVVQARSQPSVAMTTTMMYDGRASAGNTGD